MALAHILLLPSLPLCTLTAVLLALPLGALSGSGLSQKPPLSLTPAACSALPASASLTLLSCSRLSACGFEVVSPHSDYQGFASGLFDSAYTLSPRTQTQIHAAAETSPAARRYFPETSYPTHSTQAASFRSLAPWLCTCPRTGLSRNPFSLYLDSRTLLPHISSSAG